MLCFGAGEGGASVLFAESHSGAGFGICFLYMLLMISDMHFLSTYASRLFFAHSVLILILFITVSALHIQYIFRTDPLSSGAAFHARRYRYTLCGSARLGHLPAILRRSFVRSLHFGTAFY